MLRNFILLGALAALAAGCPGNNKTTVPVNPACTAGTVDMSKLAGSGVWAKQELHNDGRKETFPEFRLNFDSDITKLKYVAGVQLFNMETVEADANKLDLREIVNPLDEANVKKHNKDPEFGLRRLLYLRPKARGCKFEVMERYETYVDGKKIERSTTTGQYTMAPYKGSALSFEKCKLVQKVSPAKGDAMPIGQPASVWSKGSLKDLGGDTCKPFTDLYINGKLVKKDVEGRVDGKSAIWEVTHAFPAPDKAGVEGYWVEMYRYADCDGKKELKAVACNAVAIQ